MVREARVRECCGEGSKSEGGGHQQDVLGFDVAVNDLVFVQVPVRVTGYGLRATGYGLRATGYGLGLG